MSKEATNQMDFQNSIENIDELDIQENKINPQYYIHNMIINIQNCLSPQSGDLQSGILRFMIMVKQFESLVRAKNGLSKEYDTAIEEYVKSEAHTKNNGEIFAGVNKRDYDLSIKKNELLQKEVFANTKILRPMKV